MGKIVEKKRKKKKGRPSLLDLQKRTLKEQQQQLQKLQKQKLPNKKTPNSKIRNPSPNSSAGVRRSTRRNPNPNSDADEELPKRREKKLELVLKNEDEDDNNEEVNSEDVVVDDDGNSGSESCHDDDVDLSKGSNLRKRKIDSISRGSTAVEENDKGEKNSVVKQESTQEGSKTDDGPSTRLPDKSLLLFILDRLQKKDTYGVYSEPVDPEELPDYHEVIEHPMDFGTVRKKLADGAYASLEQFEKDVFLICSNAMQYNAPDTIYFRQARSIQELAVKNFENLRGDSDDNRHQQEPKVVRRGRPPMKKLKRPPGRPPLERANSDHPEATPATAGGTTMRPNNEVKKASNSEKYGSTESIVRSLYGSRIGDTNIGGLIERYERSDDMPGSASKGISMKHGKKHIVLDENRRNTYKQSYTLACGQEPSVLATFDRERKQLIAVGLQAEYGYARSLSRFAAKMGPVAWKVASKKIERCLPSAVKFGPGWVGHNEAPAERLMEQPSPASVGQQTPPASLGQQTPPVSIGQQTPPDSGGQQTPPASAGQQTPPASAGKEIPPASGGQEIPPASVSQEIPPALLPTLTDTALASTQAVEDSSGDSSAQKPKEDPSSETHKPSHILQGNEDSSKGHSSLAADSILPKCGAEPSLIAPEASANPASSTKVNTLNNGTGSMRPDNSYSIHQASIMQSRINGLNGSYGLNLAAQTGRMIGAGRPTVCNLQSNPSIVTVSRNETQSPRPTVSSDNGCGESKLGVNCSTIKPIDCSPNTGSNQNVGSAPPDLNVGFQSPGSPISAKADSVQPDLALQL